MTVQNTSCHYMYTPLFQWLRVLHIVSSVYHQCQWSRINSWYFVSIALLVFIWKFLTYHSASMGDNSVLWINFFLFCVCDSDFPLKLFSPVVAISNIIFRQSVKSTQASAKSTPSGTPTRQSHSKRWVVALSSTIKLQVALFVSLYNWWF